MNSHGKELHGTIFCSTNYVLSGKFDILRCTCISALHTALVGYNTPENVGPPLSGPTSSLRVVVIALGNHPPANQASFYVENRRALIAGVCVCVHSNCELMLKMQA